MKNDLDDLITRLKLDDKEAFNVLFYMYAAKLHKFGLSYFNNSEEAEEIVQEVFLKIWINRKSITDPSTFNSYIYTIAKNLIFNNLKKKVHFEKYKSYLKYFPQSEESTYSKVLYNETELLISNALDKLPKKRKLVFLLSRKVGLKNKEIAKRLNISIKTVETHMSLSLKYLKDVLYLHEDKIILIGWVYLFI